MEVTQLTQARVTRPINNAAWAARSIYGSGYARLTKSRHYSRHFYFLTSLRKGPLQLRCTHAEDNQKMADSYEDFPLALRDCVIDNILIGNQIGIGANGRILEARWEGIVVAVKEIHSIFMNEVSDREFQSFKTSFLRECEQSSRLRHPNIVRFFGIYHPPGASS